FIYSVQSIVFNLCHPKKQLMKRMFTLKLINIIEFNKKLVIREYRVNKQKNHNVNNLKTFDLMAVTKLKKE
uniref:hypothetical protein n=1 Tax=Providencia alcalifaciens TaxID=126385 RepID=UPI002B057446